MKYFRLHYSRGDTCGNEWTESSDPVKYYSTNSIKDVIDKLKITHISAYTLKNKQVVDRFRTPKGQGYGIWEENPNFNFERDLPDIVGVEFGGFRATHITEITIEPI